MPWLTVAYIWFNSGKSSVLLSSLNPRQPASVKNLVAREPAWQPATLPSLANLENANVWREVDEQGKDPGRGGCWCRRRGKQMRREPEQNFIHEFVRRRLKTTAP